AVGLDGDYHAAGAAAFPDRVGGEGEPRFGLTGGRVGRVGQDVSESCGQGVFVAEDPRQVVRQRRIDRDTVLCDAPLRQLDRFLQRGAEVHRFHYQLGWVREVVDLRNDLVEPVDFLDDDLVEILAEIGVFETLGQQLGESL